MKFEEELKRYKTAEQIMPREEKLAAAIRESKAAFYAGEEEKVLSYGGFLRQQLKFIKKKWWAFQIGLLAGFGAMLDLAGGIGGFQGTMGAVATLFVILIIPELWKNRSSCSLEIEGVSFYSLRQVYAARMLLFLIVDVFLISLFGCVVSVTAQIAISELVIYFLLPMSITACICFQVLCSKRHWNENVAVALCLAWTTVWVLIILNDTLYAAIAFPVWLGLMVLSILYLCVVIYRALNNCNKDWEGEQAWN